MPRKKKHTVKISMKGNNIIIETLDETRISHHGFGSFLIKYRPKEIAITPRAKAALMKCSEIRGLVGMEFFRGNVLSWGSPAPNFSVPIKHVSVPEVVKSMIEKFDIIE
jgi:hypothetical protein